VAEEALGSSAPLRSQVIDLQVNWKDVTAPEEYMWLIIRRAGARGSVVIKALLQTGRSQDRHPMR
jgi:hypothetical protein